ncbi:MAG: argininosuccinate synthase [Planctomycetota bacterium]
MYAKKAKKVVLAYSGGLDTSVILPWLKENYGCEVIAFAADIGQGDNMKEVRAKALASGASKVYVEDLRKEFVEDFVFPTLRAGAIYEGKYLLGTSFARPLIAKHQVRIANKEKADAVSHGATGKGNDQVRFELTYMALNPKLKIIAPWKEDAWTLTSREDAIDYAKKHGIPIAQTKKKIYSEDGNLWHLSHEGGDLEDSWNEPKDSIFAISVPIEKSPNKATYVIIEFKHGTPVAVNGKKMDSVKIVEMLNRIGGKNAIGQINMVENRLVGIKSRGVYETPGGTILHEAHRALESITLDRETSHYKALVAQKYAEMVYFGQWFTPLREALDAFVDKTQERVTGAVRVKLIKGRCEAVGVKAPKSLYDPHLGGFGKDPIYDQKDAKGFIKLFGLPLKVQAMVDNKK